MHHQRQQFSLKNIKPKSFDEAAQSVTKEPMNDKSFPMVYKPGIEGVILKNWLKEHKAEVEEELLKYGAILFRGFDVPTREEFHEIMKQLGHEFISYKDRSSPRSEVKDNVYNSTEHPADQVINMHNELSYSHTWPQKIAFYCYKEPATGGETPIADVRRVLGHLDAALQSNFQEHGVLYRRLLQQNIGLSWQTVYQTEDRKVVEDYCESHGMKYKWMEGDKLEIKWQRPAIRQHPVTNENVWFNHGYFFNSHALAPDVKAAFDSVEELPFNTFYGDGEEIDITHLELIGKAYADESVLFDWKHGDILLMDNILAAHGRSSYTGDREINVVMMQARN